MTKPESVDGEGGHGPMRELREIVLGKMDVETEISQIAGLVEDDQIREFLVFAQQEYDPTRHEDLPSSFWETKLAKRAVEQYATETASQAIKDGDNATAAYLAGIPNYSRDMSGVDAEDELEDWLCHDDPCKVVYLAALMGRGKTSFAVRCMQAVHRHYSRARKIAEETDGLDPDDVPTPEFATNFRVDVPEGVDWKLIDNYDDLVEWTEEGSSDDVRWFWFDEASSELTAQDGGNAQRVVRLMGGLVKKMRKNGVNLGTIGHDKGDVHVLFRSMADFVHKPELKRVVVYEGIKDREPVNPQFSLRGVPDATWEFDTDDMAEWSWSSDEEEIDVPAGYVPEEDMRDLKYRLLARMYYTTGLSYSKIAEKAEVGKGTVSNATDRYDPASLGLEPENSPDRSGGGPTAEGPADD
ncbi:hypothetical protein [Salinarchaeum laminariae]|uniref:hypothetical protein n=1 Tax=Salinarchaeum laminariae TaxID=869888 RepID=UPI0020C00A28|nr:hypothetical protein [Salinarchaeum laminariae]